MDLYLPIAQVPVNGVMILGLGRAVGFLSGMLGVSGGFVTTPLLTFYGIPPASRLRPRQVPSQRLLAATMARAVQRSGLRPGVGRFGGCDFSLFPAKSL